MNHRCRYQGEVKTPTQLNNKYPGSGVDRVYEWLHNNIGYAAKGYDAVF